ncbi:MAG: hypothetical protein ACRCVY_09760 [Commensalibacter sp.]
MTSAPTIHCFTSASFAYLDRVRILFQTLRQQHPDWLLWFCLIDKEPEGFHFDPKKENCDFVVRLEDLGIDDLTRWSFKHNVVELCTAVKGKMLCHILEKGAQKVFYLDPDIAVFSSLQPLVDQLDEKDVLLTPHLLHPEKELIGIADNEIGALKHGIFNLGFAAVSNRGDGPRFAEWWRDRLLQFCYEDVPNGIFTDQKWADHVPVFFPNMGIVFDEGYNVACWNLNYRPLSTDDQKNIRAGNKLLRFFHFTKVTWAGEIMLERYSRDRIEVFELLHWYRHQLTIHAPKNLPKNWWAYGIFNDGTRIEDWQRRAYRSHIGLQHQIMDPFAAGPEAFEAYRPAALSNP